MAPLPEWNHPIDWDYVSKIAAGQQIEINTSKGSIKVKLNVNEAPGSVASILKLIDKGFYNSKTFHRLVPNFVIQGGCPRGDGFGSADYSIRSEFSDLIYSSGTVGLASSGPNTESCQWFITHCATPHLDGRYTIIGHVIEGMDVVQLLGVGDVILEIKRL
ncbi:MAG: peptidylprolyl isomerase [Flavobacteriales bacterium]|nr:peptidylprolyl isomerase [Flavobacteriales bacterium]